MRVRKTTEREFYSALYQVVKQIREMVKRNYTLYQGDPNRLILDLMAYARTLEPTAQRMALGMLEKVNQQDLKDWVRISEHLGQVFLSGFGRDPVLREVDRLQKEVTDLIVTIPQRMAAWVQQGVQKTLPQGIRIEEYGRIIENATGLLPYQALRIARTETAKANTYIVKARAQSIGANRYIWRTVGDQIVREVHRPLDGQIFDWDNPPEIPHEGRHHPGDFPNCRCYPEPIITGL